MSGVDVLAVMDSAGMALDGRAWQGMEEAKTVVTELIAINRRFVNAFVASGYKPVKDSDNPGQALLFDALSLLSDIGPQS